MSSPVLGNEGSYFEQAGGRPLAERPGALPSFLEGGGL